MYHPRPKSVLSKSHYLVEYLQQVRNLLDTIGINVRVLFADFWFFSETALPEILGAENEAASSHRPCTSGAIFAESSL
jgi:hypothetical protein